MAVVINAIRARMVSLEVLIALENEIVLPKVKEVRCEMDRKKFKVFVGGDEVKPKKVQFDITSHGGDMDVDHKTAWNKLQGYAPKELFKIPIINLIKA